MRLRERAHEQRLAQAGHAFDEHVAGGDERRSSTCSTTSRWPTIALADLVAQALQDLGGVAEGAVVVVVPHGGSGRRRRAARRSAAIRTEWRDGRARGRAIAAARRCRSGRCSGLIAAPATPRPARVVRAIASARSRGRGRPRSLRSSGARSSSSARTLARCKRDAAAGGDEGGGATDLLADRAARPRRVGEGMAEASAAAPEEERGSLRPASSSAGAPWSHSSDSRRARLLGRRTRPVARAAQLQHRREREGAVVAHEHCGCRTIRRAR